MSIEQDILQNSHTVAIVGLSGNPERPSNIVGKYLKEKGYKIIPVNPGEKTILGETSYPYLTSVPGKIDVVDIFRKSEDVMPIVKEAIKIGAKVVWMQEGVVNKAAAAEAEQAGLKVVMDKCIRKEHMKLFGENKA
jgi:predicted CoA-binding protein